uniref:Uncharacterized protein n=1 Tax=Xiphophorus couchianus TaxID=32473 RepID=A0A3B5M059_9TELE
VVMPPPNILLIANDPMSGNTWRSNLLMFPVCPQSERKEEMIDKIKLLDIQTQAAIVSHIQEVTQNPLNVLDLSWMEEGAELVPGELEPLSRNMAASLQQLIDQRDKATEVRICPTRPAGFYLSRGSKRTSAPSPSGPAGTEPTQEEKQHLAVELADAKAKLRRYRQELEEKTEQLMDSKHEAERLDQELQKLKQENQSLSCEARSVRAYRDEVDALRERAARVDRLEAELSRCKERLNDVHFYKTRMEELRDDNTTLLETKVLLEEQLAAARGRCDKLHTLEKDNLLLHAKIHDLEMEREGERRRLEELLEENLLLELGQKQSMNESAHLGWELEQLSKNHDGPASESRKSLVHELNEGVSSRVLKLEKENRELQASIERLKEENQLLQEQQLHTQELDRENQSLSNQTLGEELLKEKQNLEREMHALRADKDCQVRLPLRFSEQQHLSEAVKALQERAQSSSEARVREAEAKNRLLHQSVTDAGSRLASLEAQLKVVSEEAECLRERAGRCEEVQREAARLERSREALTREVGTRICAGSWSGYNRLIPAQKELQRLAQQEAQNSLLSMENLELRRSMENLRSSSARLPTLQEELQEAQRETQEAQRKDPGHPEGGQEETQDSSGSSGQEEELVSEKLKAQQQNLELERLDKELERIGLSREKLLQQEQTLEDGEDEEDR